jgi:hypothetical protein
MNVYAVHQLDEDAWEILTLTDIGVQRVAIISARRHSAGSLPLSRRWRERPRDRTNIVRFAPYLAAAGRGRQAS